MKRFCIAVLALCLPATAQAEDHFYYVSSAGDDYIVTLNENGYTLQSRYPKARFVEAGANSHVVRGIETFYFGKSCDAAHDLFGNGTWGWANGGFGADFENGFALRFPRQELPPGHGNICAW